MKRSVLSSLVLVTIITIIIQIVISLYYSNQILTINSQFSQLRKQSLEINRQVEKLQSQLSDLQSIHHLLLATPSATLVPITKSINLSP